MGWLSKIPTILQTSNVLPTSPNPPQYTPLPFSQVDPNFSYAYTLLGHEYVMIEELEKALACYRNAVRIDPRHYNAWYGIGLTYYKQERFSLADGMLIQKFGHSLFATFSNNL